MPVNFDEIRRRREALTLTQQEAADRAELPGENNAIRWADIERGRREDLRISTLEAVAKALRCKVQDLLTDSPVRSATRPRGRPGRKPDLDRPPRT